MGGNLKIKVRQIKEDQGLSFTGEGLLTKIHLFYFLLQHMMIPLHLQLKVNALQSLLKKKALMV